jgi:hypothetical protein
MNEEEEVVIPPTIPEETVTPNATEEVIPKTDEGDKELKTALAQKDHFREKAEKAEAERKALEVKINKMSQSGDKPSLDVDDYIDISASLEGLDQREKEYLAQQHKLTGKPMSDIRKEEDFNLWQTAYRSKVEKEKLTLKPSGTQSESDRPMSFDDKLNNAKTIEEKEKLLAEAGLYKEARPKADRSHIGGQR